MSEGNFSFFDTNVLVYMYGNDLEKKAISRQLFAKHGTAGSLMLSTQVIQEFYVISSRKLKMPKQETQTTVRRFLELPFVRIGSEHILAAFEKEERYEISFWDGLVLAAAEASGAETLYTEDLNHGQMYGTVRVINPFR